MFEKIVLRRSEDGQTPSLGDLSEALLFYQKVHLVLDRSSVTYFVRMIGMEQLLEVLSRGNVSAVYCRELIATQSQRFGAMVHYHFTGIEVLSQNEERNKRFSALDGIQDLLKDSGKYTSRVSRKLAQQFLDKVPVKSLVGKDFTHGAPGLIEQATADLYDKSYIAEAISRSLMNTPGFSGFTKPLSLEVMPTNGSFFTVFSNLDLTSTNEARARLQPAQEPLTEAHLLSDVFSARADVMLASHYGSDFKTSKSGSSIIDLKFQELVRRAGIHQSEINQFQEVVVNEGRSLKEVVDSGQRTFDEVLILLDKAKLFRNWSSGVHPDKSLVAEYLKEGSREGWISSLPGKALRFVIGGALDLGIPGSGTLFGLGDALLLDKITKGWRPSHFVEQKLKPFVNQ